MKQILLLAAVIIGGVLNSYAQTYDNSIKLSAGFSGGATVGPASGYYPIAGGLQLKLEVPVSSTPLSVTFTTGYTYYGSSTGYSVGFYYESDYTSGDYSSGYGTAVSFIPVEAGIKLFVHRRIFIEGDVGASFNINSNYQYYTGKSTALIYSPGAGYSIPVGSNKNSIDLSLAYENRVEPGGGYSQVTFRAAFSFGL